ncbi:MAG: DEAD/DEAH box helicase family protein [Conexivisphaerales archaeon]
MGFQASISYDRGSILVRGDVRTPGAVWDERARAFRSQALNYTEILEFFRRSDVYCNDRVMDLIPCPVLKCRSELREYQKKAVKAWVTAGKRGIVVLPTGAGKTLIGIKAMELVNQAAIVVVPTLDLLDQWKTRLAEEFGVDIGAVGGGETELRALTVSTYDSAYLKAAELGNRFSLIIFDEVHHLAAQGYRQIAEMFASPYRLGLTATYEREDMQHRELPRLVGGIVYQLGPKDLAGNYLSDYRLERINVQLKDEEKQEYERYYNVFRKYIMSRRIRLATPVDFQRFIMRTAIDPEARRALLARNKAIDIAFNSQSKLDALEKIIESNPDERMIIFTQHNDLVYRISRRFLIPFITHTSDKKERKEILRKFREGKFRAIVTSKVLDEGIDVPDASLGVIVSGTGSSREFVQRLGRLLRKRDDKKEAKLIELVSTNTSETRTSFRRKKARLEARNTEASELDEKHDENHDDDE